MFFILFFIDLDKKMGIALFVFTIILIILFFAASLGKREQDFEKTHNYREICNKCTYVVIERDNHGYKEKK